MELENIKLIVSDLDGTLFNSDKEHYTLSEEVIFWIQRLQTKGVAFTIATGRPEFSSLWVAKKMALSVPFITYNGGMLLSQEGKIFYEMSYSLKPWESFLKKIDQAGGTILLYLNKGIHYYRRTKAIDVYERKEKVKVIPFIPNKMTDVKVKKILLIGDNQVHKVIWERHLERDLQRHYKYLISEYHYMEIVKRHISKGSGLRVLKKRLGLTNQGVMGIGNEMNDKELLEEADVGVAVANANHQLKVLADVVTKGEYEQGVIEMMKAVYNS